MSKIKESSLQLIGHTPILKSNLHAKDLQISIFYSASVKYQSV